MPSHGQDKVEDVNSSFLSHHLHHGLDADECARPTYSSAAVDDVGSHGGSMVVVDATYECNDWVRVVGYTKVRPASVVELLYLPTVISL